MPDVTEASDGYVPPPRTGPNPFQVVDPNVITGMLLVLRAVKES